MSTGLRLTAACIMLHDVKATVDFYQTLFGHSPIVDGGVDFRFEPEQVTVFRLSGSEDIQTKNVALIFWAENVDAEFERLKADGIDCPEPPSDKPWGVRSFLVHDPAGNLVSVTGMRSF